MLSRSLMLVLALVAGAGCDFPSSKSTSSLGQPAPGSYSPKRYVIDAGGGATFSEVGAAVAGSFFKDAKVQASLGRVLTEDDASMSVAVIGHGVWTQRFESDAGVVGRSITVDDRPVTIVGVMPASFTFPEGARIWVRR